MMVLVSAKQVMPVLEDLPKTTNFAVLDGSQGTNRLPQEICQINAKTDYEAVHYWLNEYRHKDATFKLYRKEAERLLLWCILQRRKPLSSLTREDFDLYFIFLDNPQPKALWCSSKTGQHTKRGAPGWKPFKGPLSPSSKNTTISALSSLFDYLTHLTH